MLLTLQNILASIDSPRTRAKFAKEFENYIDTLVSNIITGLTPTIAPLEGATRLLQASTKLSDRYNAKLQLQTILDALELTSDQNPISASNLIKLFSAKDTGLFSTQQFFNDIEVGITEDDLVNGQFIPQDGEVYPIVGGRHRLNAIHIVLTALQAKVSPSEYDFSSIEDEFIRVKPYFIGHGERLALAQQLNNTARGMGQIEIARIRAVNKQEGLDLGDITSILRYAYDSKALGTKAESFKLAFAYSLPELQPNEFPVAMSTELLGNLGFQFYNQLKKRHLNRDVADMLRFSTSQRYDFDQHIAPLLESVLTEGWNYLPKVLTDVLADTQNLYKAAKRIGEDLSYLVVSSLGIGYDYGETPIPSHQALPTKQVDPVENEITEF